jgi:hypothetical protein
MSFSLAESLKRSGKKPSQIVLIGFSLATMTLARKMFPRFEIGWVAEFKRDWRGAWMPKPEQLVAQAEAAHRSLDLSAHGPWKPQLGKKCTAQD